ncbi:hypothetical protein SBDP1_100004 [Syntrophobacter sp. SbD1]|nr:hypothetical protein SBDP1_100004 [Syntrophobacter sp. SbD1]
MDSEQLPCPGNDGGKRPFRLNILTPTFWTFYRIKVVLALFVLFSGGCAFTQANLDVKYDSEAARVGPLASIRPVTMALAISGEITSFWFELQVNLMTLDFMGTVGVNLNLVDPVSGAVLYSQSYQGYYNETSLGGLEGTWERVMNTSLERMVRDVSTDPKLLAILKLKSTNSLQ